MAEINIDKMAHNVAEKALDDILYQGKSIREWMYLIASEDCISRQAVLESIKNLYPDMPIVDILGARRKWLEKYAPYFECENVIEQLSSVNPQPKIGRWIDINGIYAKCSNCNEEIYITGDYKYCPSCGAKMESEAQNESVCSNG